MGRRVRPARHADNVRAGPSPDRAFTLSLAGMGAAERRSVAFTETFNASGQPVISLPVQATAEGLPIGVQLVAAEGRKDLLLQVSRQLEDAIDWARRWPPVSAKALDGEEGSCASACC